MFRYFRVPILVATMRKKGRARSDARRHRPLAVDLFSGCGGLSVGLKKAGFRVGAAVEIDERARTTYALNHPEVRLYEDIRRLSARELLRSLQIKRGQLDLLAGCPPCQGFSRLRTLNGSKSVRDPRNNLIFEFLRLIRALRPKMVMLENVPSLEKDERFQDVLQSLTASGYRLTAGVLNAGDYAVPQRRRRLILLASRIHEPAIAPKSRRKRTVRDAISALERPATTSDAVHGVPERRSDEVKAMIRLIPRNGGSRTDLPKRYHLECHTRSNGFRDVYGRMAWDEPAPTITSGCINPSKGRFLHPSQNRTITLREAALLQGFPKRYRFDVAHGKERIALMIGNALPPPLIAAQARPLARATLSRRDRRAKAGSGKSTPRPTTRSTRSASK